LRLSHRDRAARFGVPMPALLGKLHLGGIRAAGAQFGAGRTKRMLMLAELISAEEAAHCGFVDARGRPARSSQSAEMFRRLLGHAPCEARPKEAVRRVTMENLPRAKICTPLLAARISGRRGAFLAKRPPRMARER